MKRILFFILLHCSLFAAYLDGFYLYKAMDEYKNRDYKKALENFSKVEERDEQILYNIANTLYRLGRYSEAIEFYEKLRSVELNFKKFYNIGNSYVGMKECENGIKYYKLALNIQESEAAKYNIELCEQWLDEERKKRNILERGEGKGESDTELKEGEAQIIEFETEEKETTTQVDSTKKEVAIEEGQREAENQEELRTKGGGAMMMSQYQQQKWDKKIVDEEIETLLIPFEKGEIPDAKKPW